MIRYINILLFSVLLSQGVNPSLTILATANVSSETDPCG